MTDYNQLKKFTIVSLKMIKFIRTASFILNNKWWLRKTITYVIMSDLQKKKKKKSSFYNKRYWFSLVLKEEIDIQLSTAS